MEVPTFLKDIFSIIFGLNLLIIFDIIIYMMIKDRR